MELGDKLLGAHDFWDEEDGGIFMVAGIGQGQIPVNRVCQVFVFQTLITVNPVGFAPSIELIGMGDLRVSVNVCQTVPGTDQIRCLVDFEEAFPCGERRNPASPCGFPIACTVLWQQPKIVAI